MLERLADAVLDHRGLSAASLVVLLLVALVGLANLRIDFSSASFYGGDDEALTELQAFQAQWGVDDDVVLVVAEAAEGDVLTTERLSALGALGRDLGALDEVVSVRSLATQLLPGEDGSLQPLPAVVPVEPLARSVWAALLLRRAPFVPLLVSEDGRVTAVAVKMAFSSDDLGAVVPAVERIESVVATRQGEAGLTLELAGLPAIRAGFFRLTLRDQMLFVPITLALIALGLSLVFRRLHGVVAPGLAAGLPTLMLLGGMGLAGEPVGLLNQAYFTLIPVLAVADAVHLVCRFHEEGTGDRPAIVRAVARVGVACLLTTLTTAAGFASLAVARMPILRHFGLWAAVGMLLAYGLLLVVVPLVLHSFPGSGPPPPRERGWMQTLARFVTAHPRAIVAAAALLTVAMGLASTRVVVDNRLMELLGPDHPVRVASERVDTSLGGVLALEVDLRAEPGAFDDPEVLASLEGVESWAGDEPGVRATIGPGRLVRDYARLTSGTPPADRDAVALAYAGLARHIDLSELVSEDRGRARLTIRVAEPGGQAFEALARRVRTHLDHELSKHEIQTTVTGTTLVAYRGVNRITDDLRSSLSLVFAVVTGVMAFLFRSGRLAVIAVLPNLLPLLIGYGCVGLLGWNLDPVAAVVLTLALGIAVDDTIHILVRYREGLVAGLEPRAAVFDALCRTGRAVTITSLLISAGLAVNLLSSFPPLQAMGLLGATVMMSALACDLLLLPALLILFGGRTTLPRASGRSSG